MSERPLFNVAQLMKEPIGSVRNVRIDADLKDLVPDELAGGPENETIEGEQSLTGSLRLMHTTEGVLVEGDLEANVTVSCSRCLEPVTIPLDVPVEETFVPTLDIATGTAIRPEEEDRALWIDQHHILDMSEVLRQDVLVEIPLHVLCRPDCAGLCPTCGKNLNEGPCDCEPEIDPRWAGLADMLPKSEDEPDTDSDQ